MFVIFNLFVDNSDRRFHSSVDNLDHIDLGSQPPIDQLSLSVKRFKQATGTIIPLVYVGSI